jgi:hypothetical protein
MGRVVHGASCPWGEMFLARVVMERVVHGANCPWGEMSVGRAVYGAKCLWAEMSVGRDVVERVVMGRVVLGRVVLGRVVLGRVVWELVCCLKTKGGGGVRELQNSVMCQLPTHRVASSRVLLHILKKEGKRRRAHTALTTEYALFNEEAHFVET